MKKQNDYDIDVLIRDHGKKVYNIVFRIIGNHHDAEDIVQETFISVYQNIHNFSNKSSIFTWIYKIAVNQCINHKKKENKIIQRSLDDTIQRDDYSIPDDFEPDLSPVERKIILDEVVFEIRQKCHYFVTFRLTEEQRIAFLLRYVLDLSYKDIGYILNVSVNVVKARLSRARNQLKNHFNKNCYLYNPENSCRCENKLGYVLTKYPRILNTVKKKANNPEYKELITKTIRKNFKSVDEVYKNMPMLKYEAEPLTEQIKNKNK
ncbi:MAG: RNA polymerase sigma factor [Spirochaetes bacterium]|nr:RNA polymerase sigma factor [Spirochaetota bacterium]